MDNPCIVAPTEWLALLSRMHRDDLAPCSAPDPEPYAPGVPAGAVYGGRIDGVGYWIVASK